MDLQYIQSSSEHLEGDDCNVAMLLPTCRYDVGGGATCLAAVGITSFDHLERNVRSVIYAPPFVQQMND